MDCMEIEGQEMEIGTAARRKKVRHFKTRGVVGLTASCMPVIVLILLVVG
jgi:hypothetical protein